MRIWLGSVTAVLVVVAAGLIVGLVTLNHDIMRLDAQLSEMKGADVGSEPALSGVPAPQSSPALEAKIVATASTTSTFVLTVTVRPVGSGPADLLAEPPVLQGNGKTYQATPDSVSQARFAFLDLVTKNQATTKLVFQGAPAAGEPLTLIFNPGRRATDLVAPRREVRVR